LPIQVTDEIGTTIASTTFNFSTTVVPVVAGATYLLGGSPVALVLSATAELQYIAAALTIEPSGAYEGQEFSSSTMSIGASVGAGVEWQFSRHLGAGLKAGYRYASGEVAIPGSEGSDRELDLSGGYGAVYVIVLPWS
jgi:hypothetical protein